MFEHKQKVGDGRFRWIQLYILFQLLVWFMLAFVVWCRSFPSFSYPIRNQVPPVVVAVHLSYNYSADNRSCSSVPAVAVLPRSPTDDCPHTDWGRYSDRIVPENLSIPRAVPPKQPYENPIRSQPLPMQ
jgi:hypothetical protein